jgi:4-hydroxybenzoate polyprenyltransferase
MLAVSFGAACVALFGPWQLGDPGRYAHLALFAVLYVALLLRYRVVDEWKDHRHDARHYPDRPVQRGSIAPRTLAVLGIGAVVVEMTLAWLLGGLPALPLYALVTALTVGTAIDFGARGFFERHFSLAFAIHQLVYPAMFAWAAVALGASLSDPSTWWGIGAATSLFVSAEVVRKFQPRTSAEGGTVADTYGAVWGRRLALIGLVVLVLIAGLFSHFAIGSWVALSVSVAAAAVIAVRHRSDSWVMAGAGAHVPLLAIAMVF